MQNTIRRATGAPRRSGAGHGGPASDGNRGPGARVLRAGVEMGGPAGRSPPVKKMSAPQLTPAVPTRFLSIDDLTYDELQACLRLAAELKAARAAGIPHEQPLAGKHI